MDQIKIGAFLKDLRKERNLTQEEIADKFGVSQRSVSRWENGNTMPDISVLIELADFYDVDLREILNGGRRAENMNEDLKETLDMVADYTMEEKKKISKELSVFCWVSAACFAVLGIIIVFKLNQDNFWWNQTASLCYTLGLIYSVFSFFGLQQLTGKIEKKNEGKLTFALIWIGMIIFILFTVLEMAKDLFH